MGCSKMSKIIKFELIFIETLNKHFVRFFFDHPLFVYRMKVHIEQIEIDWRDNVPCNAQPSTDPPLEKIIAVRKQQNLLI